MGKLMPSEILRGLDKPQSIPKRDSSTLEELANTLRTAIENRIIPDGLLPRFQKEMNFRKLCEPKVEMEENKRVPIPVEKQKSFLEYDNLLNDAISVLNSV
jgi:hypothetical protein